MLITCAPCGEGSECRVQSGRSSNHSDPASTVVASQALVASCRTRTISEPNGRGAKSIDVIDLLQIVPLHAPIRATPIENEASDHRRVELVEVEVKSSCNRQCAEEFRPFLTSGANLQIWLSPAWRMYACYV